MSALRVSAAGWSGWALGSLAAFGAPLSIAAAPQDPPPLHPRLVVLGVDGLDPDLLGEVLQRYPEHTANFRWLAERSGGIRALGTSNPPQSPVAWSKGPSSKALSRRERRGLRMNRPSFRLLRGEP